MRVERFLRISVIIQITVFFLIGCAPSHPEVINYDQSAYNFTSYTSEEFNRVPARNISFYHNRLDISQEVIELGLLEIRTDLSRDEIKQLAGYFGATAIYIKKEKNFLLLRSKNYKGDTFSAAKSHFIFSVLTSNTYDSKRSEKLQERESAKATIHQLKERKKKPSAVAFIY